MKTQENQGRSIRAGGRETGVSGEKNGSPADRGNERAEKPAGKEDATMKLYDINPAILDLLEQPEPETDGNPAGDEEIIDRIHNLAMRREDILQDLAKQALNCRAEAAALKTEEARLKQRRECREAKEERLVRILDRECGENTDLGVATLRYRQTSRVEVSDEARAVAWLKRHLHRDAYKVPEPTVCKEEVRRLLKAGRKIPGCTLVQGRSCSLK